MIAYAVSSLGLFRFLSLIPPNQPQALRNRDIIGSPPSNLLS